LKFRRPPIRRPATTSSNGSPGRVRRSKRRKLPQHPAGGAWGPSTRRQLAPVRRSGVDPTRSSGSTTRTMIPSTAPLSTLRLQRGLEAPATGDPAAGSRSTTTLAWHRGALGGPAFGFRLRGPLEDHVFANADHKAVPRRQRRSTSGTEFGATAGLETVGRIVPLADAPHAFLAVTALSAATDPDPSGPAFRRW